MNKYVAIGSLITGLGVFVVGLTLALTPVHVVRSVGTTIELAPEFIVGDLQSQQYMNPRPIAKKTVSQKQTMKSTEKSRQIRYHELEQGGSPEAAYVRIF